MAANQIKQKIDEAIDIVKDVPERYRNTAFEVVLEHLIISDSNMETSPKLTKKQSVSVSTHTIKTKTTIDTILKSDYDWASTQIPKLKPIGQNLYVLKIVSEEFGVDTLSPRDIQTILLQKFRLSKSANAVSMSLMSSVGKHVDRIQEGKEYRYKITKIGLEHLTLLINKIKGNKNEYRKD